jgi:hypothetical protein
MFGYNPWNTIQPRSHFPSSILYIIGWHHRKYDLWWAISGWDGTCVLKLALSVVFFKFQYLFVSIDRFVLCWLLPLTSSTDALDKGSWTFMLLWMSYFTQVLVYGNQFYITLSFRLLFHQICRQWPWLVLKMRRYSRRVIRVWSAATAVTFASSL